MVSFFESSSILKKVTYQLNFIKVHKVANYRVRLFRRLSNLNTHFKINFAILKKHKMCSKYARSLVFLQMPFSKVFEIF